MKISFISFKHLSDEQHKEVLALRNADEVRKQMKTDKLISFTHHKTWLESLSKKHKYYAIFSDEKLIGSANYFPKELDTYEWGFYFREQTSPLLKSLCVFLVMQRVFRLDAQRLISEVKTSNQNAYRFNKSLGFVDIGEENGYKKLELTRQQWQTSPLHKLAKKLKAFEFSFS